MRWEIPGVVECAGAVEVHREGLRAERARPYALLLLPGANAARAERLAAAHAAQLVPRARRRRRRRVVPRARAGPDARRTSTGCWGRRRSRRSGARAAAGGGSPGSSSARSRRSSRPRSPAGSWRSTRRIIGCSGGRLGRPAFGSVARTATRQRGVGSNRGAASATGRSRRAPGRACGAPEAVSADRPAVRVGVPVSSPQTAPPGRRPPPFSQFSSTPATSGAPSTARAPPPSPASASSSAASQTTSAAPRLLSSWPTVAAPLSTTSAHGCASTAASASASGVTPRSAAAAEQRRRRAAVGQAPVGERLLDVDLHPGGVRAGERGAGAALVQVPGRLDLVEAAAADRAVDRRRLLGAGGRQPDADARRPDRVELPRTPASSSTPLSIVAEWIW